MARECGWTHDKILDGFTIDQLYKTYLLVLQEKMKEERLRASSRAQSMAYAFGSIKQDEFDGFLDSLYVVKSKDVNKSLDEAKAIGLPVEEQ